MSDKLVKNIKKNQKTRKKIEYKSAEAKTRAMLYQKGHSNQVRLNKDDTFFKKIFTDKYSTIQDQMSSMNEYEYICSGLNSNTRELLVIDCDATDCGEKTLQNMREFGKGHIAPDYIKIKANGHSQTGIYIKPISIKVTDWQTNTLRSRRAELTKDLPHYEDFLKDFDVFTDMGIIEEGFDVYKGPYINSYQCGFSVNLQRLWIVTTHMTNILFNGDIGYTGFNCQNPYYEGNGSETVWFTDVKNQISSEFTSERLSLYDAFFRCLDLLKDESIYSSLDALDRKHADRYVVRGSANPNASVAPVQSADVQPKKVSTAKAIKIVKRHMGLEKRESINSHIYDLCCSYKVFCEKSNGKYNFAQTCMSHIMSRYQKAGGFASEEFSGYAPRDMESHVRGAIAHIEKNYDPNKACVYDDRSRLLGLSIRHMKAFKRWMEVKALSSKGFKPSQIRDTLKSTKNIVVSVKTIRNDLMKTVFDFNEELLYTAMEMNTNQDYRDLLLFEINRIKELKTKEILRKRAQKSKDKLKKEKREIKVGEKPLISFYNKKRELFSVQRPPGLLGTKKGLRI